MSEPEIKLAEPILKVYLRWVDEQIDNENDPGRLKGYEIDASVISKKAGEKYERRVKEIRKEEGLEE